MKLFLVLLLGVGIASAQDGWKAGLASVDITPAEPVPMAGYANRTAPFEAIEQRLNAKMLALQHGDGTKSILITADLIGFTADLADRVCRRLNESDGIGRANILLNASHTHSGPLVAGSVLKLVSPAVRTSLETYIKTLEDYLVAGSQRALRNVSPARLSWGAGVAKFVMNRREFTPKGIILGTNPRGPADRTVPVLRVEDAGGRLRAAVFGAATHCTTLGGDNMRVSGDYAGFAQAFLETRNPGVQAMFINGCSGDSNPHPRGTFGLARHHASELADEVMRVLQGKLAPVRGPLQTQFRMVQLPLERYTQADIERMAKSAPSYRQFFTDGALAQLREGKSLRTTYPAPFALWQFGEDLTLAAFSGETVVDYAVSAERLLGPLNLWVSGYNNEVYGYLPSARLLAEGGYETRGLYSDYGLFKPEVEKTVLDAIVDMARKAGRRLP